MSQTLDMLKPIHVQRALTVLKLDPMGDELKVLILKMIVKEIPKFVKSLKKVN